MSNAELELIWRLALLGAFFLYFALKLIILKSSATEHPKDTEHRRQRG